MTTPPVVVNAETTLAVLVTTALRQGVRVLPVVDRRGIVVGMVTDNDLQRSGVETSLRSLQQMTPEEREPIIARIGALPVQQIMSFPVISAPTVATPATAVAIMRQENIKRLPIVDNAGHIEGLLTRSDILREIAFSGNLDPGDREPPFD